MTAPRPDVSVIIVSWNTCRLTTDCLASLPAAAGDLRWDAWVIDNASSDDSVTTIRERFPAVHLLANPTNVGFAAANNQGMDASAGRYVLLLNSDTVMPAGAMAALVAFADARPRAGVVGPRLENPDGSFQSGPTPFPTLLTEVLSVTGFGRRLSPRYPSRPERASRRDQRADYVVGACLLARREAVDEVGGLDEGYFMYSEEPDWCWRMRSRRWETWYTPASTVVHFGGQSTGQVRDAMVRALYRAKVRFLRRHRGALHGGATAAAFVAVSHVRRAIRGLLGLRPAGVALAWQDVWAPAEPPATGHGVPPAAGKKTGPGPTNVLP